jgi:hypothetical protein
MFAIGIFFARPAFAADKQLVAMFSFKDSCGEWVASQDDPSTRNVYLFWFRGFVSGFNYGSNMREVPLDAFPDNDTLALYIDKYCRENPLKPSVDIFR